MATRAIIARKTDNGWEGGYHHFDGYPTGLGAELHRIATTVFGGNIPEMTGFLIDQHPGGWSTIQEVDWTVEPGYGGKGPECYCHGDYEGAVELRYTHETPRDHLEEYLYIIDEHRGSMEVIATPLTRPARVLATVRFNEPLTRDDWRAIEGGTWRPR